MAYTGHWIVATMLFVSCTMQWTAYRYEKDNLRPLEKELERAEKRVDELEETLKARQDDL